MIGLMMNTPLTIGQILEHAVNIHGDKHVHTILPNGKIHRYNYATLHKRVNQLSNATVSLGINQGDRIATFVSNTFQHLELYFAIPNTSTILHPLNVRLSAIQLEMIVKEAGNDIIFVDNVYADQFANLQDKIQFNHTILINNTNQDINNKDSSLEYEQFISEEDCNFSHDIQDENCAMALCYTSGTDGEPKGVLYTHRAMYLHTLAVNHVDVFGLTESDVVMPLVPMYHAMAWGIPFAAMLSGAELVLHGSKQEQIVDLICETGVTVAAGVPTVWKKHLPEMIRRKQEINTLTQIIVGGEAMPISLIRDFEKELGIEVRHAWGMTEMSPTGTLCTPRKAHEKHSYEKKLEIKAMQGRPIPGVQIRLMNGTDNILPWDGISVGELQVRSPWTVSSYYNTEPTLEHFTEDGWLRTGDLATINSEGYIQIVDRMKSVIRSGGESISSVALETYLMTHPQVKDSVVIGIPDEQWGERPLGVVVLATKNNGDITEILRQYLSNEFPKFWLPDKFVVVDELPKTGVGKTDKQKILRMIASRKHNTNGNDELNNTYD